MIFIGSIVKESQVKKQTTKETKAKWTTNKYALQISRIPFPIPDYFSL